MRYYISVREDTYAKLAAEARKQKTTITKVMLELVGDIVGADEIEKARRRYRRRS